MRIDRNIARDAMRVLSAKACTPDELREATGSKYSSELISKRLRIWSEEGRLIGRHLGLDADGKVVIAYRLREGWSPTELEVIDVAA